MRRAATTVGCEWAALAVQAATTGPVSALLDSKRHRDNGAILAWPERAGRAAMRMPSTRGGYTTPRLDLGRDLGRGCSSRVPARCRPNSRARRCRRLGAATTASSDDPVAVGIRGVSKPVCV